MHRPTTRSGPARKGAAGPVAPRSRFPGWLIALVLVLVSIAVYSPVAHDDFVNYDDNQYVLENVHVTGGLTLENARWAFGSGYAANWHPVTWLSHMLDCQLFGLNPRGPHLTSGLLHALNVALLFLLLQQLTGALWRSLWVAALFGLHPLRVESVAWIAERKDVLSGFFGLLSLLFYARYACANRAMQGQKPGSPAVRRPTSRLAGINFTLALFFFALGLMSKPMLVTLPFVMLLLDYWPLNRIPLPPLKRPSATLKPLLMEKLPFFTLAAVACVVTFWVQKSGGAVKTVAYLPLGARIANAMVSYVRYLEKLVWPSHLAVFYPMPNQWPIELVVLAGGVILAISVALWVTRSRFPFLLVGWLWFLGTLVPVIGLVQVGDQAMADRYTYLPSIGALILGVWGACELFGRWRNGRIMVSVAGSAAVVICIGLTQAQLAYWANGEALFRHALAVTDNNYLAYKSVGDALDKKGQTDEAIRYYQEAVRLRPTYADVHNNLGAALARKGQAEEAIVQYQEAIRLRPEYAEALYNLGNILGSKGRIDEAITLLQEAIHLKPDYAEAHNDLGTALGLKGRTDEAISQFREAIRSKPEYASAHSNLGAALDAQGHTDEAIGQFQEAIHLNPGSAEVHNNLGSALLRKGQTDQAITQYREAVRLRPDYAEALYNLGNALGSKGQLDEAIVLLRETVRLKPQYPEAHNDLGIAFGMKGQPDEAITQFQEALRLRPDFATARKNLDAALAAKSGSSKQ